MERTHEKLIQYSSRQVLDQAIEDHVKTCSPLFVGLVQTDGSSDPARGTFKYGVSFHCATNLVRAANKVFKHFFPLVYSQDQISKWKLDQKLNQYLTFGKPAAGIKQEMLPLPQIPFSEVSVDPDRVYKIEATGFAILEISDLQCKSVQKANGETVEIEKAVRTNIKKARLTGPRGQADAECAQSQLQCHLS